MVKVVWTPSARQDAESVYCYYDGLSHVYAKALMDEFLDAARQLKSMPEIGPKEPLLEHYNRNYRYKLVHHRYKLIYLYENQTCSILMIWDCRQNPKTLERSDRFES